MQAAEIPVQQLVIRFTQQLHAAKIPNILWGQCLLNIYGVPSIVSSIDYAIPEALLSRAVACLGKPSDLQQCPDLARCTLSRAQRPLPPPSYHVHIAGSELSVALYLQSETLWFLPEFNESLLPPSLDLPQPYTLASNAITLPPYRLGRGFGALEATAHPVIIPKSHILLEAFMRIYARDFRSTKGQMAMSMIDYMDLYVDGDGYLDPGLLSDSFKQLYLELKDGKTPVRQWSEKLRSSLDGSAISST